MARDEFVKLKCPPNAVRGLSGSLIRSIQDALNTPLLRFSTENDRSSTLAAVMRR